MDIWIGNHMIGDNIDTTAHGVFDEDRYVE